MTTSIPAVANTAQIRDAEFVRLTVTFTNGTDRIQRSFYFSSSYQSETIDGNTYGELGALVGISSQQRDITSTGADTSVNITGLDSYWIYVVAGGPATASIPVSGQAPIPIGYYPILKGSQVQIRRGFYDTSYNLTSTVLRYTGIITNYAIEENRDQGIDALNDTYTISLNSSAIRRILENRIAGRKTNESSWKYWASNDTSMDRVAGLENTQFDFGRPVASVSTGGGGKTSDDNQIVERF